MRLIFQIKIRPFFYRRTVWVVVNRSTYIERDFKIRTQVGFRLFELFIGDTGIEFPQCGSLVHSGFHLRASAYIYGIVPKRREALPGLTSFVGGRSTHAGRLLTGVLEFFIFQIQRNIGPTVVAGSNNTYFRSVSRAGEIGTAELGLLFRVFRQCEPPNSNVVPLADESWNQLLQEIKGLAALFDHSADEQMAA